MRKIIHIDMDAFFASVEMLDHPELRTRPIAVAHDLPRSVVSTANYLARRSGVHSAQPVATAKRLCPDLVLVEPHFARYKEISAQIHSIFSRHTTLVEPLSIDEAFLDVTHRTDLYAQQIAQQIKDEIFAETKLTASAGVSYNKLLAKIASDFQKPNGLTVVTPQRALSFLDPLPVEKLWGVGPKTAEQMHRLGVVTCRQLRDLSVETLNRLFGKSGTMFFDFARGIDHRPVETEWERKSLSCETTFETDISTHAELIEALADLTADLIHRLQRSQFLGQTITLKIKFDNFMVQSKSLTMDLPFTTAEQITRATTVLLSKFEPLARPIRLMGIGISRNHSSTHQASNDRYIEGTLPFNPPLE